jgi:hypothetical protein
MTTRRELIALSAASALAQPATPDWLAQVVQRHDSSVERTLQLQITDPGSRWRGIYPDEYGLHHPGTASGVIDTLLTAYLQPKSRYHNDKAIPERIKLAGDFLAREQTADGNINLIITNFNSPPDSGFVVRALCPSVTLAKRAGKMDLVGLVEPFLRKAGEGLAKGGIHTPNHRWVVSAALSQLYDLFGESAYLRRIDQWLAEGIDIDAEGQYSERSTYVYNPITNNAFVTMAAKLQRPALLDPVRRNLASMLYLLHPEYEVVTEISRRQDLNQRGDMGSYWFALAYMANHDKDGRLVTMARHFAPTRAPLSALMEYPELASSSVASTAVPDDYRRAFPHNSFVRIRRGPVSATVLAGNRTRFFTLRNGQASINAIRFASAFFGRGQFSAAAFRETDGSILLEQELEAPYYQPLDPARPVDADQWAEVRRDRKRTEICRLKQSATILETKGGFRLRVRASGTSDVPVAVEINFAAGGELDGVVPAPKVQDGWLLTKGTGSYRVGGDVIRFGPGFAENAYTQIHRAEPKLAGPSVYLTGFTPFDRTIDFECVKA